MPEFTIWSQIFAAVSASLIFTCSGFHCGWWTSSAYADIYMSNTQSRYDWMSSILSIGAICGALLGLILVDTWGRRRTLLLMAVPFVSSWILIAMAINYWCFYLARFIAGLGIGVAFMVTPMYIGEIAECRIRGSLCVLMPVMMNIGQIMAHAIGSSLEKAFVSIIGSVISTVFFTTLLYAPESPYYYAMRRFPMKTQKSVAWLIRTDDVIQEAEQIRNSVSLNQRKSVNFMNLFKMSGNRKALFVIIGLLTCEELCGYSAIVFYFAKLTYTTDISVSFELSFFNIVSTHLLTGILVVFLADRVGRKPLLLASVTFCAIFLSAEALHSQLQDNGIDVTGISSLPALALIGYLISYSIGLGTLPIVVGAEMFPCQVKAFGLAISTVYHFAASFALTNIWQLMNSYYDTHLILYGFAACNIVSAIFIYFLVPETKGRSLNEIQSALQGRFETQL